MRLKDCRFCKYHEQRGQPSSTTDYIRDPVTGKVVFGEIALTNAASYVFCIKAEEENFIPTRHIWMGSFNNDARLRSITCSQARADEIICGTKARWFEIKGMEIDLTGWKL